ncbi:Mad3/BUB1 homology region 1-domain-containing protein [Xylariomycetidae sp. FL2044]|nr:Mad3/BUB1 homology region 1-domain-containing protein [Xylariomycetidae sp. FL2044]
MAAGDLIDFDVIEGQKENIQSLPGGRSAKKLAEAFSPSPLQKLATPTPQDTKTINDCIRAEYEEEVANLSESDDPLDIFERYVRWTLDAYPSAQATPQSQLHTLLERATKAFIGSSQYKNDPRYLKLWLHYIRFFSDSPRETYVFLSRHGIGEGLGLFYEEYAAWLESAGRWTQAEEVYKLGIEREARPVQRLVRKFGEFEQRRAQQPEATDTPSSPALPSVRPALAAKIDPYAAAARAADPQAPRPNRGVGGQSSKPGKSKLTIFSDASSEAPAMSSMGEGSKGWDTIGSLADRKKENVVEAKPWVGETLQTGVKKSNGPKMAVFRDPKLSRVAESHIVIAPSKHQVIVNPASGRRERIFVNLEAVYATPEEPGTELSFEELWAASRGWLDVCWDDDDDDSFQVEHDEAAGTSQPDVDALGQRMAERLVVHHDVAMLDENGAVKDQSRPVKPKKKKIMEVNETQIIKAKLDSPSGPKIKKKTSSAAEPTMTLHTRAATDEIYELFNAPLEHSTEGHESDDDEYMTDGDYTSGAESTGTTRQVTMSEAGDDDENTEVKSVSEWSEFTARKHIPQIGDGSDNGSDNGSDDGRDEDEDEDGFEHNDAEVSDLIDTNDQYDADRFVNEEDVQMSEPDDAPSSPGDSPPQTRTRFIPIPPEDYEPPTRPYRDPVEVANNRLPFMTPITERTESSLGVITEAKLPYYNAKTPSRNDSLDTTTVEEEEEDDEDFEPPSSPLREILSDHRDTVRTVHPLLPKPKTTPIVTAPVQVKPKGPIIRDAQCNPVDITIREEILTNMHPPLSSYTGFYDHRDEQCDLGSEIRRFAKSRSKSRRASTEKTDAIMSPVTLSFPEVISEYTVKREIGAGAFAPVYLVENSAPEGDKENQEDGVAVMGKGAFATTHQQRSPHEALKMEQPPSAWEFHIMRLAATRIGPHHRALASLCAANELHLYRDEAFLFLPFHAHGSVLDVVNFFKSEPSGVMDEQLAMFFSIELLRTVEALHAHGILHGDLKADNCLLRLDPLLGCSSSSSSSSQQLSQRWSADGAGGWAARGVTLIDFGRGIDMRAFAPNVRFVADWKTSPADCVEMRQGRPWTYQIDYHGLAGIVHCLLFGKYIETVECSNGGGGAGALGLGALASAKRYKVRESFKRYWQTEIWARLFDVLLNPAAQQQQHAAAEPPGGGGGAPNNNNKLLPVTKALAGVRETMEAWLEANCDKGVGLRGLMARVEAFVKARKG